MTPFVFFPITIYASHPVFLWSFAIAESKETIFYSFCAWVKEKKLSYHNLTDQNLNGHFWFIYI